MDTSVTIGTLTLNPALDIATVTDRVTPLHKLRCDEPRYDPGGGGINVARVVKILGGKATAIYPVGGPAGKMLEMLLESEGVPQRVLPIKGQTRESFTVDERATGQQFRFVLPGPSLSADDQEDCLKMLDELNPYPKYFVVSGSLPPGVSSDFHARVARRMTKMGVKLILDSSEKLPRHAGRELVFLMKPNLRELSKLVGRTLQNEKEQIRAARQLLQEGYAEVVLVSLGGDGALLVTADNAERFAAPEVPIRSAVGAGDSMVGAIVLALSRGDNVREAVRFGIAAGAAALLTDGTELCRREDVEAIYRDLPQ